MQMYIDESIKKSIWKRKENKPKYHKLKMLNLALLILAIYCACFSVFYSVMNPQYTLFYGAYGNITTSGRIITMFLRTIGIFVLTSIPYFIAHLYFQIIIGKDLIDRKKEKISIEDKTVEYEYISLVNKTISKIKINIDKIDKITYSEDAGKITVYGEILENVIDITLKDTNNENKGKNKKLTDFSLYNYFKPDLLHWFETNDVKVEYLFCFK